MAARLRYHDIAMERLRSLREFHGKVAQGLSVEMSVKLGPVTLLAVVQTRQGELILLTAEGESVAGPISGNRQYQ